MVQAIRNYFGEINLRECWRFQPPKLLDLVAEGTVRRENLYDFGG